MSPMKGVRAAAILVAIAALAAAVCLQGAEGEPQGDHPEADVIISDDGEGGVLVTVRTTDETGATVYETRTVRAGADHTVANLSDVDGTLTVVMTGGSLGTLTILNVDADPSDYSVDIDFTMLSGSVDRLLAVSVPSSVEGSLSGSYFTADGPVGTIGMEIHGEVGELVTTEDLLGVDELILEIGEGAEVDRLYPTGTTGRYGQVTVVLSGGHVGYMSNQAAVVTYLDYRLLAGTVDYLCLGADTEGGRGYYLNAMWTFYVQRDFSLMASQSMEVGTAVLGAGILSAPTVLCNGEEPAVILARNVILDAPYLDITLATCFQHSSGVYRFSDYTIGGSPSRGEMRTEYYQSYQRKPIYGEGGIWGSAFGATVPGGVVMYTDTDLSLGEDAELLVEAGGRVVSSGLLTCAGTVVVEGTFTNNGVVERRDTGSFEGDLDGSGLVATAITARPNEGRVDVMTVTEDAVLLRASVGDMYFNTMTAIFNRSDSSVLIQAPDSMYVGGEYFVVALYESSDGVWEFYMTDLGTNSGTVIELTVPGHVPEGYSAVVTDLYGDEMEVVSAEDGAISFRVSGSGTYALSLVPEGEEEGLPTLAINSVIAAAIVLVAAIAVYFLIRRDRGPGPS